MSTRAHGVHGEVPGLTALRGIAALLVCLMHLAGTYPQLGFGDVALVSRARLGVELFVLMSGFVVYHVHADGFARGVSVRGWADFMVSRLARVWPLAAVATLLAVALHVLAVGAVAIPLQGPRSLESAAQTLLMVNGLVPHVRWNYPSWSITAEMLNYLAAPFLIAAVRRAGKRTLALAALACLAPVALVDVVDALLARDDGRITFWLGPFWAELQGPGRPHLEFVAGPPIMGRCLPPFLLGAVLARAAAEGWLRAVAGPGTALAAGLAALASVQFTTSALPAVLAFALLVAATAGGGGRTILETSPLRWLGEVSFGVYMLHAPIQLAVQDFLERSGLSRGPELPAATAWALLLLTLALALLGAEAARRWVERPARSAIRAAWAARRAPGPAPLPAAG